MFQIELNSTLGLLGAATHGRGAWEILLTTAPHLTITKSHVGNFAQGQIGAAYTVTVSNAGAGPTSGMVTVTDALPSGLTLTGLSGTGWACTVGTRSCDRSDPLASTASYPSITVTVNVAGNTPPSVTNSATVSGGGDSIPHTANDPTTVNPSVLPDLTITKTHTHNFTQGQTGATYTLTVSNIGGAPTNALVAVDDTLPLGLTATGLAGTGWTCTVSPLNCQRGDAVASGGSYPSITLTVDVASNALSSVTNTATVSGGGDTIPGNNTASDPTIIDTAALALRFIPVTPCRVADTRNPAGPFGGPSLAGGSTRSFPVPSSSCGIPSAAKAYSLNATVVPHGPLGYLTLWPTGAVQPLVSTLNSYDGQVTANAAMVPAGTSGSINAFVTNDTDLILDINGYFLDTTSSTALMFYSVAPCRVVDTRNPDGTFGGPILNEGTTRSFPITSSACGIPATAQAFALNATVVPSGFLGYLTLWPTGVAQPLVSTLNAYDGQVTANMAIVQAGTGGAVSAFVTNNDSHLILDITGYFAPPASGGLQFYTLTPCRVLDTRNSDGTFGGPIMSGGTSRSFPVPSSACSVPASAQVYSMNATVVPSGFLGYLTVWPTGVAQPLVSTLNAYDGQVTANALIVSAGTGGAVSAFVTNATHLIFDVDGYFALPSPPSDTRAYSSTDR